MWSKNSARGQRLRGSGVRGGSRVAAAGSAGRLRSGGSADGCGEMFDALAGTTAVGMDGLVVVGEGSAGARGARQRSAEQEEAANKGAKPR